MVTQQEEEWLRFQHTPLLTVDIVSDRGGGGFVVSLLQKREVSDVWKQGSVFV